MAVIPGLNKANAEKVTAKLKVFFGNYPKATTVHIVAATGDIYMEHEKESATKHAIKKGAKDCVTIKKGDTVEVDPTAPDAPAPTTFKHGDKKKKPAPVAKAPVVTTPVVAKADTPAPPAQIVPPPPPPPPGKEDAKP